MVSLSNHGGRDFAHILRQAQDDTPLVILILQDEKIKPGGSSLVLRMTDFAKQKKPRINRGLKSIKGKGLYI
jgi:hypothetical protein